MSLELLFLGTGTSAGVPMIGCECEVCRSTDPRDARTRPSVLIRYPDPDVDKLSRQYLIDASAELRLVAIRHDLKRIDGVFITHTHADHVFGLDDLRRFNAVMNAPIDIHAEAEAHRDLARVFKYVFEPQGNVNKSFIPDLLPRVMAPGMTLDLFGGKWTALRLMHGRLPVLGYRIDYRGHSIAYCTDVSGFPPETYPLLQDLDVLVIDALRYRHHPTHLTVDQALEQIEQIQPRRAYLTHIAHDIRHADLETRLPEQVYLSFDGLVVSCGDDVTVKRNP